MARRRRSSLPSIHQLLNHAPWSCLRNADFGYKLVELENVEGFNLLKKRLNPDEFGSALTELEIAANCISTTKFYYDLVQENTLIIKNRYSKFPINEKILTCFVEE